MNATVTFDFSKKDVGNAGFELATVDKIWSMLLPTELIPILTLFSFKIWNLYVSMFPSYVILRIHWFFIRLYLRLRCFRLLAYTSSMRSSLHWRTISYCRVPAIHWHFGLKPFRSGCRLSEVSWSNKQTTTYHSCWWMIGLEIARRTPDPAIIAYVSSFVCLFMAIASTVTWLRFLYCSSYASLIERFQDMSMNDSGSVEISIDSGISDHTRRVFALQSDIIENRSILADLTSAARGVLIFMSTFSFVLCCWSLLIVIKTHPTATHT